MPFCPTDPCEECHCDHCTVVSCAPDGSKCHSRNNAENARLTAENERLAVLLLTSKPDRDYAEMKARAEEAERENAALAERVRALEDAAVFPEAIGWQDQDAFWSCRLCGDCGETMPLRQEAEARATLRHDSECPLFERPLFERAALGAAGGDHLA